MSANGLGRGRGLEYLDKGIAKLCGSGKAGKTAGDGHRPPGAKTAGDGHRPPGAKTVKCDKYFFFGHRYAHLGPLNSKSVLVNP